MELQILSIVLQCLVFIMNIDCGSALCCIHGHGFACLYEASCRCVCDDGYSGAYCQNNIDDCVSNPCQNQAKCIDDVAKYTCLCGSGYSGTHCENNIACQSQPCSNGGTCTVDKTSGHTCHCPQGFAGDNCEVALPCQSDPCSNGGICTDDQGPGYTCHCPLGFTGNNCEQDPVVLIKPSIILPESKIIPEGYSVLTIPCYAEGIPFPNITWESLDKQSIPQNARQLAHYLVIRNVSKDDGGHYMCTAKNKIGTDIKVVQIIVRAISEKQIAPLIHAPSYVEVKYYLEGRLTCNVTGFPTPIVIWRHNNNVVQSTGKTLVIQRVTNATTGIYTCIAKNHAGTSQANIQLKVTYDTPKIITPPITSVIMAGKSHNFSCIATGHPTPTIKWTYRMYIKHTTDMPSHQIHNHGSVLTLYTIDTQESGQLTCTAQNEFGEEHVSVSVIVRNSNPVG